MDCVAKQFGVSRQTLYRQLKLEGTTFEEVLDRVRRDAAHDLLRGGVSVSAAAVRLGFSDSSAFDRERHCQRGDVFRSEFLPRLLGVLLAISGAAFVAKAFASVLAPQYASPLLLLPVAVAWMALTTWLLVKGVDTATWQVKAADAR